MSDSRVLTRDVSGFVLEQMYGVITAVTNGSQRIEVGQRVCSNGQMFRPEGLGGIVVGIIEPYTNGCSSDILLIRWDESERGCSHAKFKDLTIASSE